MSKKQSRRKHRLSGKWKNRIILAGFCAILAATAMFFGLFYITDIEVAGSSGRYTNAQIIDMAVPGIWGKNSAMLWIFRRTVNLEDVPFMESVEVEIQARNKIRLHVNENNPIGYVRVSDEEENRDYYFDSDGKILEVMSVEQTESLKQSQAEQTSAESQSTSQEEQSTSGTENISSESTTQDTGYHPALTDVPMVTGLTYVKTGRDDDSSDNDSILIQDDPAIFNTLQSLTRMIDKFDIHPDYVEVASDDSGSRSMTLYYGTVRVMLGTDSLLEEKITRVAAILPSLTGRSGVLHLEDFSEDTVNIVFDEDV